LEAGSKLSSESLSDLQSRFDVILN
jgi:hypothetical protein